MLALQYFSVFRTNVIEIHFQLGYNSKWRKSPLQIISYAPLEIYDSDKIADWRNRQSRFD
jgi:hypothetical protein